MCPSTVYQTNAVFFFVGMIIVTKNLYHKATSAVLFNSGIEDWFQTTVGV